MEETIDLREYFGIIKKRSKIIVAITLIAMAVSGIVSFFMLSPVYEANTTLIVNKNESSESQTMTGDEFNVTQKLAVTYGKIITSRTVLNEVIKNLKLDMEYGELSKSVNVSAVSDTQIISITVQDTNPKKAMDIANAIPKIFTEEAKRITKANGVEVIDKAVLPSYECCNSYSIRTYDRTFCCILIRIYGYKNQETRRYRKTLRSSNTWCSA